MNCRAGSLSATSDGNLRGGLPKRPLYKCDSCYTVLVPGRVWPFREFGYLTSSARTRITSAITNRQSMAIVIKTRIQDDFSSNRPHLLCVGTARRSLTTARGPTARSSGPIFPPPLPHTQMKRFDLIACISTQPLTGITPALVVPPRGCSSALRLAGAMLAG